MIRSLEEWLRDPLAERKCDRGRYKSATKGCSRGQLN